MRLSLPNKHHFLVDLAPFGLDNPGEVFYAADRPYGLIEAAVVRDEDQPQPTPGATSPASCDENVSGAREGVGMTLTQYNTAISIDGFIADENNSLDWLFQVPADGRSTFAAFFADVGPFAMCHDLPVGMDKERCWTEPTKWTD